MTPAGGDHRETLTYTSGNVTCLEMVGRLRESFYSYGHASARFRHRFVGRGWHTLSVLSESASASVATGLFGSPKYYRIPVTRDRASLLDRDRALGHLYVMRLLPDDIVGQAVATGSYHPDRDGERGPRSLSQTLWRVGRDHSSLEIITRVPVLPHVGATACSVPQVTDGQRVRLRAVLEAVHSPMIPVSDAVKQELQQSGIRVRSRRVRVPDEELVRWVDDNFERRGWRRQEILAIFRRRVRRRGSPMHLVEVVLEATAKDAEKANDSLVTGIGHGKNYGAGMVTIEQRCG